MANAQWGEGWPIIAAKPHKNKNEAWKAGEKTRVSYLMLYAGAATCAANSRVFSTVHRGAEADLVFCVQVTKVQRDHGQVLELAHGWAPGSGPGDLQIMGGVVARTPLLSFDSMFSATVYAIPCRRWWRGGRTTTNLVSIVTGGCKNCDKPSKFMHLCIVKQINVSVCKCCEAGGNEETGEAESTWVFRSGYSAIIN